VKRYVNLRRIHRWRSIARVLSFGGLGVMVIALLVSLRQPDQLGLTLGLALVGLLGSQIGTMLMRRWPDQGRSDQEIDAALKGLDGRNSLFHYELGCRHALITPRATVALIPIGEPGIFEWRKDELWRTRVKKGVASGDPAQARTLLDQAEREAADLGRKLRARLPQRSEFDVVRLLVFCSDEARLERDSNHPAVHLKKLKEYVRNLPRAAPLTEAEAADLAAPFEDLLISD
jgi:hypothetical protein